MKFQKFVEIFSCKSSIISEVAVTRASNWHIICQDWWSWRIFHSWLWALWQKSWQLFEAFWEKFREINLPSDLIYYSIHSARKNTHQNAQVTISNFHKSLLRDTSNFASSFTKFFQICCFRSVNFRWSILWWRKYCFTMISCRIRQKTFVRQIFFDFVMIFTQKRTWGRYFKRDHK